MREMSTRFAADAVAASPLRLKHGGTLKHCSEAVCIHCCMHDRPLRTAQPASPAPADA